MKTETERERDRESGGCAGGGGKRRGFQIVSFVPCRKGDGSRQTIYCILNEEGSPPTLQPILLLISPSRDNLSV